MRYTKEEIIKMCEQAMSNVSTFYNQKFVNYRGKTTDTKELYTEIISEFLIDNIENYKSIPQLTRNKPYTNISHIAVYSETSNRIEEITAMKIFEQSKDASEYNHIGIIIDYQTPLKNVRSDVAGKIDLLSRTEDTLFVLELKIEKSTETMLRCVLEAYTYLKTLNHSKLICNFKLDEIEYVKASPLVFKNGNQRKEMQEDRPNLKRLMKILDSVPYYISLDNDRYTITDE